MRPADYIAGCGEAQQKWRAGKVRPLRGNAPHDRPVSRDGLFVQEHLRRSLSRPFSVADAKNNTEAPVCVFLGMAESITPMWSRSKAKSKSKTKPWGGTAPPPVGRPRAQVKERVARTTPFSSFAMSSDRLILDRVGRHQSPSPLHRQPEHKTLDRLKGRNYH